jgi:hypothetical protein
MLQAVREVSHVGRQIGSSIGGRFQGPDIRPPMGMEIEAFVAATVEVRVKADGSRRIDSSLPRRG